MWSSLDASRGAFNALGHFDLQKVHLTVARDWQLLDVAPFCTRGVAIRKAPSKGANGPWLRGRTDINHLPIELI